MNKEGVVAKMYDNGNNTGIQLTDGFTAKAWHNNDGPPACKQGDTISFAYTEKPNPNNPQKPYISVKGAVAVVAGGGGASAPSAAPAPAVIMGRNGAQVGASINQALEYMVAAGAEVTIEGLESIAEEFLHMGDRLSKVETK